MEKQERINFRKYKQRIRNRKSNLLYKDPKALKQDYRFLMRQAESNYEKRRMLFLMRHKLGTLRKENLLYSLRLIKYRIRNLCRFIRYIPKHLSEIRYAVNFHKTQYEQSRRQSRKEILTSLRENGETLFSYWSRFTIVGQKRPIPKAIKWIRENIVMRFMKCQMETDDMDSPKCNKKAEYFLRDEDGNKLGYFCYDCYQDIARSYWEREYDL